MRSVIYAVAAVAALGILIAIATMPSSEVTPDDASATSVVADAKVMEDAGTMTLAVPTMHCEFSCFPKVKETLEGMPGVQEVVLDKQKEEGVVDNRQVVVSYEPGFDVSSAIGTLAEKGFSDSGVVQ